MRAAEDWASAVLQHRRQRDKDREREAAIVAALAADAPPKADPKPPPPDRGWRVKAKRPQPILPDAGATDDYQTMTDPFA
jgi:hypothetical protein